MKIIGLTGGISTGKSTVSHFIATSQIPVVDADVIAREVVVPGKVCYHLILDHFGLEILDANSQIDRAALGNIIFNNTEERIALNNITHPRIRIELLKKVLYYFLVGKGLVVLDTPLLFEAGFYRWVHSTVVVYCPANLQLERLMARDNISNVQAKAKMDSQMSIEQKKALAHHVIDNAGAMASTRKQTEQLIKELQPPVYSTVFLWAIFFWPAFCLYFVLQLYTKVDTWRHVGVLSHRPIPEVIKAKSKPGHIAPAAGPYQ
jgi:dephospho-CoA kinase